jgi:hypothetical protein
VQETTLFPASWSFSCNDSATLSLTSLYFFLSLLRFCPRFSPPCPECFSPRIRSIPRQNNRLAWRIVQLYPRHTFPTDPRPRLPFSH